MIFTAPALTSGELNAIARIEDVQKRLEYALSSPQRWHGALRREAFAGGIRGSNSIEGYNVSIEDAAAAIENEEPDEAEGTDWQATLGYRNAMTYVLQLAQDPHFEYNETLVRSLHYMMLFYDLSKHPGQWRRGPIYVERTDTGEIVYQGPDADLVPGLVQELVEALRRDDGAHPLVRAAMAHLNLAMIQPFSDGNGRMSRGLQTLVLGREGITSPIFSSIEEWLGRHTPEYYDILSEVGAGSWQPDRNALPWVRFCLGAHHECAQRFLARNKFFGELWTRIQRVIRDCGLHERTDAALLWAAVGYRIRNATYRSMADINDFTASRDLKKMVECGLLEPKGERRGRTYVATKRLSKIPEGVPFDEDVGDPFAPFEPQLPGFA